MSGRVGDQPVVELVEEGKALHLRETAKINVDALFAHVIHLVDAFFKTLHTLVRLVGVQNLFQRALFRWRCAHVHHFPVLAFDDVGHDVFAQFVIVSLGIMAIDHLYLQVE